MNPEGDGGQPRGGQSEAPVKPEAAPIEGHGCQLCPFKADSQQTLQEHIEVEI